MDGFFEDDAEGSGVYFCDELVTVIIGKQAEIVGLGSAGPSFDASGGGAGWGTFPSGMGSTRR